MSRLSRNIVELEKMKRFSTRYSITFQLPVFMVCHHKQKQKGHNVPNK